MTNSFPYTIDADKKIVRADASGLTLTKELIVNSAKTFKNDPLCDPEFDFIFDYSAILGIDIPNEDFNAIIKAEAKEKAYIGKVALVMGRKNTDYIYASLYADVAPSDVQHMPKVFVTMKEAEQWIGER